ncbi:MAG: hypothetical protein VR64_11625 [Desulfatitalea sp. BRH_c12]|nr:MAG: hypothetical protein VR64_11625 [Desulfatitalea sp. BRH_c12]
MIPTAKPKDAADSKIFEIHIVSDNLKNGELLRLSLEKEFQVACKSHHELTPDFWREVEAVGTNLVLFDCSEFDDNRINNSIAGRRPDMDQIFLILFNASQDRDLKQIVINHKIRGIFYKTDSLDRFLKGIREILEGDLWLPRKIISECIDFSMMKGASGNKALRFLSFREKEIMQLISAGASNRKIAEELNISIHTVKTHLYNIYKKIGVPNRLKALIWATTHMHAFIWMAILFLSDVRL